MNVFDRIADSFVLDDDISLSVVLFLFQRKMVTFDSSIFLQNQIMIDGWPSFSVAGYSLRILTFFKTIDLKSNVLMLIQSMEAAITNTSIQNFIFALELKPKYVIGFQNEKIENHEQSSVLLLNELLTFVKKPTFKFLFPKIEAEFNYAGLNSQNIKITKSTVVFSNGKEKQASRVWVSSSNKRDITLSYYSKKKNIKSVILKFMSAKISQEFLDKIYQIQIGCISHSLVSIRQSF